MANENIETIMIGDKYYNKEDITPSEYFDYVKGLKKKVEYSEYDIVIDTGLKMLEKTKITGQTEMAKELTHQIELALRELDAAKKGFDVFVDRKDIEKYISKVESKSIKIIELSRYSRDIPDDILDKVSKARDIFDELYIVFTDYSLKETKKVAKERRDKDPIMFGAFTNNEEDANFYVEDRFFFIADWIEDKCDLTLEEIIRDTRDKENRDITYQLSVPSNEKQVKALLDSYRVKDIVKESDLKPKKLLSRFMRRKKKDDKKK